MEIVFLADFLVVGALKFVFPMAVTLCLGVEKIPIFFGVPYLSYKIMNLLKFLVYLNFRYGTVSKNSCTIMLY